MIAFNFLDLFKKKKKNTDSKPKQQVQNNNKKSISASSNNNAIAPINNNATSTAQKILNGSGTIAPVGMQQNDKLSELQQAQKKQQEAENEKKKAEELRRQVAKEKMQKGIQSQTQLQDSAFANQFNNQMSDKVKIPNKKDEKTTVEKKTGRTISPLEKKKGETDLQAIVRTQKENTEKTKEYKQTSKAYQQLQSIAKNQKDIRTQKIFDNIINTDKKARNTVGSVALNILSKDPTYGYAINLFRRGLEKAQTGQTLTPSDVLLGTNSLSMASDEIRRQNEKKLNKVKDNKTTLELKKQQASLKEQLWSAKQKGSKHYEKLLRQYNDVSDKLQTEQAKMLKKTKGVAGKLERGVDTFVGGFDTGVTGMDSAVDRLLGFKSDKSKGASQIIKDDAKTKAKGKVEKIALDVTESIGQMVPSLIASVGSGGLATGVSFASFGGSAYDQAKRDGYTDEQATKYGIVNGGLEATLNKVLPSFKFGGKNVYGKTATDKFTKKIMSKTVGNEAFKRLVTDAGGEFTEEYLQSFLDPIVREALLEEDNGVGIIKGKKASEIASNIASYTSKNFFSKENAYAGMLGALTSGSMGTPSAIRSNAYTKATGRSAETGLTRNEQSVVDSIVENRKQQLKEQNGKVTKKEISKIEQEVKQDLQRGYIDTNDIERALSNEAWTRNNEVVTQKENLEKQLKELQSKKMSDMTVEEYNSTNNKISNLQQQIDNIDTDITRSELNSSMNGKITDNDTLLQQVYGQELEKQNDYKFDEKEEQTKFNKTINDDIKNLKLNNHIKTRDTVDLLKKLSNETGQQYRLIDNNDSRVNKFEGKTINGFVENGEVFVNIDSDNLINRILGHETTHLFEGTEEHSKLRDIAKTYAETKGEYESRRKALQETYKDVKDADIENELTADIVGDYIFSDIDFVRNLSTEQPNMFQKIYNRVKHLYNMATAGSKEARQLEQLKYNFEKVYKENNQSKVTSNNIKYALKNSINNAINDVNSKNVFEINTISDETASKIKELTGVDVTNRKQVLYDNDIRHMLKEHGDKQKEESKGQIALTTKDLLNIPDILENYDELSKGAEHKEGKTIRYKKNYSDNQTTIVEVIPKKSSLKIKTMWKTTLDNSNSIAPISTSKTQVDSTLIKNNIPQNEQKVNSDTSTKYSIQNKENNAQELDNSSFSLDKNANVYKDLLKTNNIEYFKKDNGDVKVYLLDTNKNLVNDFTVWSKGNAISTLGEELGNRIFETATENNQTFKVGNDINNTGSETDYFMTHRPTESGITADNIINQDVESPMPTDMYEHPEWYSGMDKKHLEESMAVLNKIRNNPDAEITIYRATKGNKINPGDWVSLSKSYTELHNETQLGGTANIIEKKVKAKDVQFAGDDLTEWGYFPKEKTKYSISVKEANTGVDNNGVKLSKEQQKYFENSKATDEKGNLITVYHTTTDEGIQFNEFNPIGTENYRFGNQIVNFYTNSKKMSGSYADYKYKMANTKTTKLDSIKKANEYINTFNNNNNDNFEIVKDHSTKEGYMLMRGNTTYEEYSSKNILLRSVVDDINNITGEKTNYQYEGYVNITNPYVVDANGRTWDNITTGYNEIDVRYLNELSNDLKQKFIELADKSINNFNREQEIMTDYQKQLSGLHNQSNYSQEKFDELNEKYTSFMNTKDKWEDSLFERESDDLMNELSTETKDEVYFSKNELFEVAKQGFTEEAIKEKFSYKKTTNDIINQVLAKNKLGENYDGVIIKNVIDYGNGVDVSPNDVYVTFNSNQFKALDNTTPTIDPDIRYQMSNKNNIAPIKKNNKEVFGKEMRKQQDKAVKEAIAPLKEEVKALKKEVAELKEETTYNDLDNFDGDLSDYVPVDATVFHGEQISDLRNFTKNKYLGWGEKAGIKDKLAKVRNELNFNDNLTPEQRKQLNTEEAQLSFALNYPNYRERLAKYENHQKKQIAPIDKAKENPKEYMPYLKMSKEINPDETNSEVVNLLNEVDSKNNNSEVKTKPRKQGRLSDAKRTAQYLFSNRNVEIDEYARETGNKNIKLLADHINNIQGEITTNINEVQTDNFGNAIGKGIAQIYDQARAENLSEAFDDYLFNKSNMARHLQGKGSVVDYNESEQLVKAYEETYPQMKEWANEVNNYNTNLLYKQADAGLITHELADNLTKMYDFYVPFMENIDSEFTPNETGQIKTRSTVKSARGGADKNLLGFEEAMMRQTQSAISQIRKNQLYQEIVNTKTNRSMDFENNTNPNIEGGIQESGGKYYLTAYVDGKAVQTEIDKNLYHGLNQRGDKLIKQYEKSLSVVTKPLQYASNIRRNILTTWSPTFLVTNPLKDLQDAPLNSKYAKDWAKNVPRAFKEMATGKGTELDAFLNMYGKGNLRGDYNIDSGLADVTKLAKTNKKANTDTDNGALQISKNMLKKIPQLNEIIEMAPRYAEYLASIENGCSQMEALYNAREVTTNFGRGGIITKALNRNGFTFMNASVQGFSKLVRNFSGENGTKAVLSCVAKASALGLAPALINVLLLGDDDDYEAIPDYIKDNYYLFKTSDNNFIRIPKGRMMSIFGSAGRRALERANGKRDELNLKEDISSYFSNAYNQVGVQNPSESNIFAPIIQAKNNKTWYGTDLVPKRLQTDKDGNKIPAKDQYDASTDKMSIWLGKVTGISPYKINYVVDQYSGGIGDMILPTITEEAQSKSNSVVGKALAPLKDKFTADSITDNKNVTNFYSKVESLGAKKNETGSKKDEMSYQYMRNLSFEMGSLYKEMREVQADKTLSNSKKYAKVQNIKAEINKIAEEGMRGYKDVESYENYARVGNREMYKYKSRNGKTGWSLSDSKYADDINTLGLSVKEKNDYYTIKMKMSDTASKYGEGEGSQRFRAVLKTIRKANLPSDAKYELYNSWYGKNNKISKVAQDVGIDADTYLDYQTADLSADKNRKGYSIRGSKANKVIRYLNKTNLDYGQKAILYRASFGYKGSYSSSSYSNAYNNTIINYLNTLDTTYEEDVDICKRLGFKVDRNGNIKW